MPAECSVVPLTQVAFYQWPVGDATRSGRDRAAEWFDFAIARRADGTVAALTAPGGRVAIAPEDVRPWVDIDKQAKYKYLLCMEGNSPVNVSRNTFTHWG